MGLGNRPAMGLVGNGPADHLTCKLVAGRLLTNTESRCNTEHHHRALPKSWKAPSNKKSCYTVDIFDLYPFQQYSLQQSIQRKERFTTTWRKDDLKLIFRKRSHLSLSCLRWITKALSALIWNVLVFEKVEQVTMRHQQNIGKGILYGYFQGIVAMQQSINWTGQETHQREEYSFLWDDMAVMKVPWAVLRVVLAWCLLGCSC